MSEDRNIYGFPGVMDPRDPPLLGTGEHLPDVLVAIPGHIKPAALAEALARIGLVIDPVRHLRTVISTRCAEEARR